MWWKFCSLWGPHLLTEWHILQGKNVSSQLQDQYAVKDDDILHGIVTDDNSEFHCCNPKTECSMEWQLITSPKKK